MNRSYLVLILLIIVASALVIYSLNRPKPAVENSAVENIKVKNGMQLTSTTFENNGSVPSKYTCDFATPVNPPLEISNIPLGTKSLALIVDDPDVPKALKPDGVFDHWVIFNISPDTANIPENASTGIRGNNGTGKTGYIGPCPPREYEPSEHRYFFRVYALDIELSLKESASKSEVLAAIKGHILVEAELIGRYKRVEME